MVRGYFSDLGRQFMSFLEEAEAAGLGALDNSALIQVLRGLTAKAGRP